MTSGRSRHGGGAWRPLRLGDTPLNGLAVKPIDTDVSKTVVALGFNRLAVNKRTD